MECESINCLNINEIEKIDKIIFEQFKKFNQEEIENKKIYYSFIDEIISSLIMVYDKIEDNCLKIKEIFKFEDIKDNIEWRNENLKRIPYYKNKKIKAIKFSKNNLSNITKFIS